LVLPLPFGERVWVRGLPQGGEGEWLSQMIPLPGGERVGVRGRGCEG